MIFLLLIVLKLGLTEEFKSDLNPKKINLSVGVYQDNDGNTPTLPSVIKAEKEILDQNISKTYKPIEIGRAHV